MSYLLLYIIYIMTTINITKKITFARYGTLKHYINVTNYFNSRKNIKVSPELFNYVEYPDKVKTLVIVCNGRMKYNFKDGDNIIYNPHNNIMLNSLPITTKYDYILTTNVRDEKNIMEWVIYHLNIGFDYIYIIDHCSKIPVQDIIDDFSKKNSFLNGRVGVTRSEKSGAVKMLFLNNIIIPHMKKICNKYFIHLDGDEYINLNNNFKNIDELLTKHNYPVLYLHWLMYGSNNLENNTDKNGFLLNTFTRCDKYLHELGKSFINIKYATIYSDPHIIKDTMITNIYNKNSNKSMDIIRKELKIENNINEVPAFINHYFVQSKNEYLNRKINRIRDDIGVSRNGNDIVYMLNLYNDITYDNLINEYEKVMEIYNYKIKIGFVIIRHVNSEKTNTYWQKSYDCIRKFYNEEIVIIDDNSNQSLITKKELVNCKVVSYKEIIDKPARGELLPYLYFIKNPFCDRMIVLHDSMYVNKYYNFYNIKGYYNFTRLFYFHNPAYKVDIKHFPQMSKFVNNGDKVFDYHQRNINSLKGTFGICYVIDHIYIKYINDKYNLFKLSEFVDTRNKRQCLERFLSTLFEYDMSIKNQKTILSVFGLIFDNLNKQRQNPNQVYIEKVFTGR
jgi:hypothetical protein